MVGLEGSALRTTDVAIATSTMSVFMNAEILKIITRREWGIVLVFIVRIPLGSR